MLFFMKKSINSICDRFIQMLSKHGTDLTAIIKQTRAAKSRQSGHGLMMSDRPSSSPYEILTTLLAG